jgi:hypothetical protein
MSIFEKKMRPKRNQFPELKVASLSPGPVQYAQIYNDVAKIVFFAEAKVLI